MRLCSKRRDPTAAEFGEGESDTNSKSFLFLRDGRRKMSYHASATDLEHAPFPPAPCPDLHYQLALSNPRYHQIPLPTRLANWCFLTCLIRRRFEVEVPTCATDLRRDHLLEQVLLVEEDEHGGLLEDGIPGHLAEETQRFLHPVDRVVLEQDLISPPGTRASASLPLRMDLR